MIDFLGPMLRLSVGLAGQVGVVCTAIKVWVVTRNGDHTVAVCYRVMTVTASGGHMFVWMSGGVDESHGLCGVLWEAGIYSDLKKREV